jgi:hypothetical protein
MSQIAGILGSTALGMMGGVIQNQENRRLMELQMRNQMKLNQHANQMGKEMWDYTNYENQRKHMEKAGLNVGLMYGNSGGAGGTTSSPSGGSAGMQQAPNYMGMALQAQQVASQTRLNDAQAKKLEAETDNEKGGVKTSLELKNINQQWQNDITAYEANVTPERGRILLEKLNGEMESAVAKGQVDKATADEEIKIKELEVFEKQAEVDLKNAKINESKENVKLITQKVAESITWLEQNNRSITAEEVKSQAMKQLAEFGTGTGAEVERGSRVVGNVVNSVMSVRKMRPSVKMESGDSEKDGSYYKKTIIK